MRAAAVANKDPPTTPRATSCARPVRAVPLVLLASHEPRMALVFFLIILKFRNYSVMMLTTAHRILPVQLDGPHQNQSDQANDTRNTELWYM